MPTKVPIKHDNSKDDDDYEIVSFEDFCDKSPGSKTDLLTLNDNINYRLCYENAKTPRSVDGATSSGNAERQSETSLSGENNVAFKKRLSGTFAPFGRHSEKTAKGSLFRGVMPKPKKEAEAGSDDHQYERFSANRSFIQRIWDNMPGWGSGMLALVLLFALGVSVWWAVSGTVGGPWGDEQYRKLWERAHPDTVKTTTPIPFEKIIPEVRYHDHNNLSAKNKVNSTDTVKKSLDLKRMQPHNETTQQQACDSVETNLKFDCYPGPGANQESCAARGCCWLATARVPSCFYPPEYHTYRLEGGTEHARGFLMFYQKISASPYPDDFERARLEIYYVSDDILQIRITDANKNRFEVPIPPSRLVVPKVLSRMKYKVELSSRYLGFSVTRTDTRKSLVLNATDVGALILSDRLLQLSLLLPNSSIFGFGEHRARFQRDVQWRTYTMFNRDVPPTDNINLYGTHPFYLAVEPQNGRSHGMFLYNSNAMDVVTQPGPAITYRTTGGVLDLLLFLGPTPAAVIQQYTTAIGRPFMPPYWSLGFHLCKFGYHDLNTTRNVWKSNRDAGIPFDVQWNDIDYMVTQNDFTYDKGRFEGLPQFVRELHAEGMHYVILIDPGVSASEKPGTYPPFDRGLEMNVFIKNSTNQPFIAKVWNPVSTAFPDFLHPNATEYWREMMTKFHEKVEYDGAWIDMNEPSNFLEGQLHAKCEAENLPYKPYWIPEQGLNYKTLCMDARHHIGTHYDLHNLYGVAEAICTNYALAAIRGKRPFVISRASYPSLGHSAGHWSGDISSTWDDMRMSIPALLSFSLFGVPMMGADICGFNGNTTEELCRRWMQLGAFYPFSRNHNEINAVPQDPVSLGPAVVAASREALRLRYKLLPYYYTLFWRAHVFGDTVARPLFFEFPKNDTLLPVDDQFMIGSSLMVTPLLEEGAAERGALFPDVQRWYNAFDGQFICTNGELCRVGEGQTVSIQGGSIIPIQEPPAVGPVTTTNCRSQPLQLIVVPSYRFTAKGELYWDDGDSLNSYEEQKYSHIEFTYNSSQLYNTVRWWGHGVPQLNNITVLRQPKLITIVTVNGADCEKPHCHYTQNLDTEVLYIHVTLSLDTRFNVSWFVRPPPKYDIGTGRLVSHVNVPQKTPD